MPFKTIIDLAALKHRVELLGYKVEGEELNTLYEFFLVLADEKKQLENDDLHYLGANTLVLVK